MHPIIVTFMIFYSESNAFLRVSKGLSLALCRDVSCEFHQMETSLCHSWETLNVKCLEQEYTSKQTHKHKGMHFCLSKSTARDSEGR